MFTNTSTQTLPIVRYPKRTKKLARPIAVQAKSKCPVAEAFEQQREEERYLTKVAMIPFAILMTPAVAMFAYLILNPDAFMIPIAP